MLFTYILMLNDGNWGGPYQEHHIREPYKKYLSSYHVRGDFDIRYSSKVTEIFPESISFDTHLLGIISETVRLTPCEIPLQQYILPSKNYWIF